MFIVVLTLTSSYCVQRPGIGKRLSFSSGSLGVVGSHFRAVSTVGIQDALEILRLQAVKRRWMWSRFKSVLLYALLRHRLRSTTHGMATYAGVANGGRSDSKSPPVLQTI